MKNLSMYRIKNQDSILGGVCLGLADYYRTDVTLLRVIFVLLFFTVFPVGLAYFVLWIFLPTHFSYLEVTELNNQINLGTNMSRQNKNGNIIGGLILIVLGAIFSFKTFWDINLFHYLKNMWPLILIALGVWVIIKEKDDLPHDNQNTHNNSGGTSF